MANAKTQTPVVKHTTRTAGTLAASIKAKTAPANTVVVPTGAAQGSRKQQLTYPYGQQKVKLVASAAKGPRQKLHLQALQAAWPSGTTNPQAQVVVAALVGNNHTNPKRIWRQACRAGIVVKA